LRASVRSLRCRIVRFVDKRRRSLATELCAPLLLVKSECVVNHPVARTITHQVCALLSFALNAAALTATNDEHNLPFAMPWD
jgi:hypothetical protein